MINEELKIISPVTGFSIIENGSDRKEDENLAGKVPMIPGINPISKADRIRERAFRNRIRNSKTKYLKSYLKG